MNDLKLPPLTNKEEVLNRQLIDAIIRYAIVDSVREIKNLQVVAQIMQEFVSIHSGTNNGDDDEKSIINTIGNNENVESDVCESLAKQLISKTASEILEERDYQIILMRFGYHMTQGEVANHFKLSHQRIDQIEKRALKKIRSHLDGKGVTKIDDIF